MIAPTPAGMAVTRPTLEQELAWFREALDMVPDVADRHAKGEKFNAFDLDHDEDRKAICIGPITSRPLSLIDAPSDVAGLLEAALRVASTALAALAPVAAEGGEKDKLRIAVKALEAIRDEASSWGRNRAAKHFGQFAADRLSALRTEPTGGGEGA